ncbi:MAG: hypothetical protein EBU90_02145 [Proteobacteria bacterium]|nr:hypothetical protein [Pseudomonadota bacterium]NBP13283.1 hypothetical protein [bacterium]
MDTNSPNKCVIHSKILKEWVWVEGGVKYTVTQLGDSYMYLTDSESKMTVICDPQIIIAKSDQIQSTHDRTLKKQELVDLISNYIGSITYIIGDTIGWKKNYRTGVLEVSIPIISVSDMDIRLYHNFDGTCTLEYTSDTSILQFLEMYKSHLLTPVTVTPVAQIHKLCTKLEKVTIKHPIPTAIVVAPKYKYSDISKKYSFLFRKFTR